MLLLYPREQSVSRKVPPPPQEKYLYQTLNTVFPRIALATFEEIRCSQQMLLIEILSQLNY